MACRPALAHAVASLHTAGGSDRTRIRFIKTAGHTIPGPLRALFGNKLMRGYKTTFDFATKHLVLEKY